MGVCVHARVVCERENPCVTFCSKTENSGPPAGSLQTSSFSVTRDHVRSGNLFQQAPEVILMQIKSEEHCTKII